ncbi:hypothetical protein [Streptomyces sp. ok210]|jgi:hypothetical protein|uniref:hypothetical protein n=1 Tax=Streptomyces sp. ok210 TaxID=1761905 RepID=UPI0008E3F1AD|nr:hypothetical protein [Streptomyces sp. ok210]SFT21508.1 hypothetical protein SAMN04487982_11085 [Streptomyces sp. ok210]
MHASGMVAPYLNGLVQVLHCSSAVVFDHAGRRRFFAGQSRWPRSRQNRIGSAAVRRDARALSRVLHSNAWLW